MGKNDNASRKAPKDGSGGAKRLENRPRLKESCGCCSWWMRETGIEAMLKDDKSAAVPIPKLGDGPNCPILVVKMEHFGSTKAVLHVFLTKSCCYMVRTV